MATDDARNNLREALIGYEKTDAALKKVFEDFLGMINQSTALPECAKPQPSDCERLKKLKLPGAIGYMRYVFAASCGQVEYGIISSDDGANRFNRKASFDFDKEGQAMGRDGEKHSMWKSQSGAECLHYEQVKFLIDGGESQPSDVIHGPLISGGVKRR